MIQFDLIQTLALGGVALFVGFSLIKAIPVLGRYNIPAAVVGGLLVALLITSLRVTDTATLSFDTSLQTPLMTAFFTSIGLSASVTLLRAGSGQALVFLALASILAVVQNLIGIAVAMAFGEAPLLGVLMSSTALTGGPATALAFAPQFAAAGVPAAESLAIAAAMAGIVLGGLFGGPIATRLLVRHGLERSVRRTTRDASESVEVTTRLPDRADQEQGDEDGVREALKALTVLLVAMAFGGVLSAGFVQAGLTLPGYVGAMLVGALIRNIDDRTGWIRIPQDLASKVGAACLTLFLVVALMNLKLWELASLALPLIVNLVLQLIVVALFCAWVVFRVMGRDYDAAVMSGGFTGFMLGTTANAMAVMRTIVERFGPAPRAFLVAPIVGAFFIDFTNAVIITTFLNFLS
ncbi:MAG: sodium/glutamate symporter [Gammaproteobacteria bacterium]|jgi:glutamate:Na+ symporter, ESS family|nr:sodium/glutamate symporter [Gammaproteobacteria bacterium]